MSWNDIIRRVLPPVRIDNPNGGFTVFEPHTTSSYGWRRLKDGSWEFHKAGDFNYNVGPNGQTGINLAHPELRSPVTGIVTRAGEGKYGTVSIRDANGLSHEILHTHSQHVAVGDPVIAGQIIGTMGNTGASDQHLHYQLKDSAGNILNPFDYWDQQGRVDPNPAPSAHLGDYQRYLATPGAAMGDTVANAPPAGSQTADPADAAAEARKNVRVLGRLVPGRADLGGHDADAPATTPNQIPTPDRSPTFAERFGNWVASPTVTAPLDPYQPIAPQPQSNKPPDIVTGQPRPNIPLPPWLFGLPNSSETPGDEAWSLGRLGRANWRKE